jgi:hypothetical protein
MEAIRAPNRKQFWGPSGSTLAGRKQLTAKRAKIEISSGNLRNVEETVKKIAYAALF